MVTFYESGELLRLFPVITSYSIHYTKLYEEAKQKITDYCTEQTTRVEEIIAKYRKNLEGKKAAVYVGGGFKAISLIHQFTALGMKIV